MYASVLSDKEVFYFWPYFLIHILYILHIYLSFVIKFFLHYLVLFIIIYLINLLLVSYLF